MNVMDVFTQAKSLNLQERTELVKLLVDTLSMPQPTPEIKSMEHWGQNLVRLLNEQGPIDLIYPEIEDAIAWVKQIRSDQLNQRLGDWGKAE